MSILYRLYFALISFIAIVSLAVISGILVTKVGKFILISDDEYYQHQSSWVNKDKGSVIQARHYDLKSHVISSLSWILVLICVFAMHYPRFLRLKNEKQTA